MTDRTVVYRLRAELTQFRAQMAQGSASVKKFSDDLTAVDKAGAKSRRGLESFGNAAGKVGLAAAVGLGAAVVAAANFDQSMSAVQAATHESTQNMELLRTAAIKAGQDTVFSATEAASGMEELAKAGVSTKDILDGGLTGSLNLAAAGAISVGDAAETAASAMTQFKLKGDQVGHIADLLAAGAGKAQGSVHDLGEALNQSGVVASQMGLSIEEATGTLSAFAHAGLIGSDAGTSFKQMLLSLTPSSAKAKNVMDELGISAYDAQGNFVGMAKFAGILRNSLKDMSEEQRNATLKTIFGSDAVRAASVIYDQGSQGIQSWIDKTNDAGYAAETAATRLDNLKGDLEQFRGSLETALIGTGEGAQGPLRSLVQNATDVVNAYNKMPAPIKSSVTKVLATIALLGGGAFVFSRMVKGVASTREALENLGVSSGKATRAMKGLAAAGGALVALDVAGAAIEGLQRKIDGALPGVETLTARLIDMQKGSAGNLGAQFDDLGDSIDRLSNKSAQQHFSDFMSGVFDPVVPWDDRAKGLREAADQVAALDAALANIVSTGSPDQAAKTFDTLTTASHLSADQISDLQRNLPQYREALAGVKNQTALTATETDKYSAAAEKVSRQQERMAARTKRVSKALHEQHDAAKETGHEFVTLGDGLNKAKVSLDAWIKHFARQADALKNFRVNAQAAAKKGLDDGLIASLEKAGPEGALRMKQLAGATEEQIAAANKSWRAGQREVEKYADFIAHIPKPKDITPKVNVGPALSNLQRLQDFRFRDKTITIQTVRTDGSGVAFQHGGGFATGGFTGRGGKYEPAGIVHRGEFVFDAAATRRAGVANLYALQRQLRGYASGGFVQPASAPITHVSSAGIDYNRLAMAMANVRPLYGDVHLQPHNYNDFQRQMQGDRQQASLGGRRVG